MIPKLNENVINEYTESVADTCTNSGFGEPGSNCSVVFTFAKIFLRKTWVYNFSYRLWVKDLGRLDSITLGGEEKNWI